MKLKSKIVFNNYLSKINTYEPGKSGRKFLSKKKIIKLSSNESPLSFNKEILTKIKNIHINLNKYPDPLALDLRDSISKKYKINKSNIIFGNGSDELFFIICYSYLNEKLEGLYSQYGFLIYPIAIKSTGAKAIYAKENNLKVEVDKMISKASNRTKVCFVANPNNPTGTYLNIKEIKRLREGLPKSCLLVIDSAYSEYVVEKDYSDSISYAKTRNDIIVTHTFSKIFGIPSLRIGWAYCPKEINEVLNKIRPAFNLNAYGQKVAKIILEDKNYLQMSIEHNTYWKKWLHTEFDKLGFDVKSGVGNFIFVDLKNSTLKKNYVKTLELNNIFIRSLESYRLYNCVRISIGLKNENKTLINVTKKFLKEKKNASL